MVLTMKIQNFRQKNVMLLTVNQMAIIEKNDPIKILARSIESSLCDYSGPYI